jgi:hypothetical protein
LWVPAVKNARINLSNNKGMSNMVGNLLAEGCIGKMHGCMHNLVSNPFKTEFMRKNYDAAIKTYDAKHHNFIYSNNRRCIGNAWATNFWRGFDGLKLNWDSTSKQTPSYAMWRAGRDIKSVLNKYEKET